MSKYNIFLFFFIITVIATVIFLVFYINSIFSFVIHEHEYSHQHPLEVLGTLFSPPVLISGIILFIASLVYRVLGIVAVAKNNVVSDGEKALWIIGFIIMGFITAIVFLVMAKGKKFV